MAYPSDIHTPYTLVDNTDDVLATHPNTLSSEVSLIETKVGTDSSAVASTIDYFLKHASGAYRTHKHDATSDDGSASLISLTTLGLTTGTSITEISTDGTLADDSDNAVSTEKAVKTYVDSKFTTVSRARGYQTVDQYILTSSYTKIKLNNESHDELGELYSSLVTGVADATEVNKLHDADGGFTSALVGATVYNTSGTKYAVITGFVDSGELDLDSDGIVSGQDYIIHFSRFTATLAGYYYVKGSVCLQAPTPNSEIFALIYKNGALHVYDREHAAYASELIVTVSDVIYLAVDSYVELYAWHNSSSTKPTLSGTTLVYMSIHRLS